MKDVKRMNRQAAITCAGILALAVVAQANAQGQGPGPRASVASTTECALPRNDAGALTGMLEVTTTLTNRTSGASAEVRDGTIAATYKEKTARGNASETLGSAPIDDLIDLPTEVDPELGLAITAEFDLCDGAGGVLDEVENARELNGKSTVEYGLSGGGGNTRTVENRCTDDPDTSENEGGIRVADFIGEIQAACAAVFP